MAETPLLRTKTRESLERGIRLGCPPFAVGASLGLLPKVISAWMAVGLRCMEETPEKPERPDEQIEFPGPRFIAAGDWYKHEVECLKLARITTQVEGLLIGKLTKRMWAASSGNTDMMKFLFKQYTHVHGISEPKNGATVEIKSGDAKSENGEATSGGITVYLPHNGREELPTELLETKAEKKAKAPAVTTKAAAHKRKVRK